MWHGSRQSGCRLYFNQNRERVRINRQPGSPGAGAKASGRTSPDRLPELMDAPDCDRQELADALVTLGRVNRYLGGGRMIRRQVSRLLAGRSPGPVRILDVGAGGGDVATDLLGPLGRAGWAPSFVLADCHESTLELCRENVRRAVGQSFAERFSYVRLDGVSLPFPDGSFDVAFCTTTLHHLQDDDARELLGELARVSRIGWTITDLRRSKTSYALMRALSATVWRGRRMPRADAPVSVLRSFTPVEARRLALSALAAGPPGPVLERSPLRWALRGTSA